MQMQVTKCGIPPQEAKEKANTAAQRSRSIVKKAGEKNEKQKTITFNMEGEKRTVYKKCKIHQQKSWSSHISNKELKELFYGDN